MATSDIMKQAVFDARIVQLPARYAVEKGGLSVTNAPYNAIAASASQHTYNLNIPSQNVFVDRAVDWSSEVALKMWVDVATGVSGEPVVVLGRDLALAPFPLQQMVQTTTATINDTNTTINLDTVMNEVLRLTDYRKNRLARHCPTMLDRYARYADANGAINSPLNGYLSATSSADVPNGAWGQLVFTNEAGVELTGSGSYVASGITVNYVAGVPVQSSSAPAGGAYPIFLKFFSSEKLILSPFIFADSCEWETGLFGKCCVPLDCGNTTTAVVCC